MSRPAASPPRSRGGPTSTGSSWRSTAPRASSTTTSTTTTPRSCDALRDRGFYIADHSTANYLKTAPSIESARNLQYLDGDALRAQAKSDSDWGPIYHGLQSPFEVQEFLGNLGYRFIYAGTFWSPMGKHPSAEINYVYDKLTPEFLGVLQRATMLRALDDLIPDAPYDWRLNRYNQTLYELRSLRHASTLGGPKFIQTQLALNHEPYVFHPDGSFITADEARSLTHTQQYVEQLKYTNTQMLAWVDQLLDVPEDQRPIIVLLADEGPWPLGYRQDERGFDWTTATPAELKQKFGILNAVYLPAISDALPDDEWCCRAGFVHRAVMEDFPDLSGYQVYACGVPIMVDSARADFIAKCSLPEDEFYADSFTTAADLAKT